MANLSMPWIKLYIDLLDDPKIGKLPRSARLRFIELMLLAGECDADGELVIGGKPMTTTDIGWRLRDTAKNIEAEIAALVDAGIVTIHGDRIYVTNFSKRQGRSQSEKREAWRERKARKQGDSRGNHAGITRESRGNPPTDKDKDKEQDKEKDKDKDLFALEARASAKDRLVDLFIGAGLRERDAGTYAQHIAATVDSESHMRRVENAIRSLVLGLRDQKTVRNPAGLVISTLREWELIPESMELVATLRNS
jgi:hypothetical protein